MQEIPHDDDEHRRRRRRRSSSSSSSDPSRDLDGLRDRDRERERSEGGNRRRRRRSSGDEGSGRRRQEGERPSESGGEEEGGRERRRKRRREEEPKPLTSHLAWWIALGAGAIAPWLGGGTALWSKALLLAMVGAAMVLDPPTRRISPRVGWVMFGLFGLSLTAFLPAGWMPEPRWRTAAVEDLGIPISGLVSPQPLVSLDAILQFGVGLLFFYWLMARPARGDDRLTAVRVIGASIALLAVAALALYRLKTYPTLWANTAYFFGPFPNRNHFGTVLALGAVCCAAAGFDGAARSTRSWRTWVSWIPWAVGLAAIYLALVQNASRFGILLFFGGLLAWAGFVALYTKSITRLAMSAAGVLALLAAFFLFGGQAFEKFAFGDGFFDRIFADGRVRIYYDCLLAFKELPIFGYGLGNFEFAFNLGRVESLTSERALHPESDWLWVFIELGYAAVFLLPAGIFMVLARFTPLGGGSGDSEREKARRRGRRVRLAAVAGAGAFVLHSLFDVPGHVWGSVLPALVLGAIAAHPFDHRPIAASWSAWLFRAGGTFAVMLGMLWGAGAFFGVVPPGASGAVFLVAKAREAADDPNQTPEAAADAAVFISRAIELEPMRWDHYFFRGSLFAQIGARGQDQSRRGDFLRAARDDFRRARYLEPLSPRVPEAEANVWLSVEPRYAIAAWREVLRRDSLRAHEYYGRMVHAAREHPELRDGIRSLSFMYPKLRLAYLSIANDDEFGAEMQEILDADPELKLFNADQKAAFFQHWARRGDKIALLEQLYENEEWMNAGWRIPAAEHAARGEYEEAYILALRHVERPTMPGLKLNKSVKQLRQEFYNHPTDLSRGISLFFAQDKQGLREEAVQTLDKVSKLEGAPGYIVFLQAEAWAKLEDYKTAYEKLLEADRIAPRLRAEK